MRLTLAQRDAIRSSVNDIFGVNTKVWLFESRVDDSKRGGDIDLLIRPTETRNLSLLASKIRLLSVLETKIGERKVDVVIGTSDDVRPIVRIAHETGVLL